MKSNGNAVLHGENTARDIKSGTKGDGWRCVCANQRIMLSYVGTRVMADDILNFMTYYNASGYLNHVFICMMQRSDILEESAVRIKQRAYEQQMRELGVKATVRDAARLPQDIVRMGRKYSDGDDALWILTQMLAEHNYETEGLQEARREARRALDQVYGIAPADTADNRQFESARMPGGQASGEGDTSGGMSAESTAGRRGGGRSMTFRLMDETRELLWARRAHWSDGGAYGSVAEYLEALYDRYAAYSIADREEIYFGAFIDSIETVLRMSREERRTLLVTYRRALPNAIPEQYSKREGRGKPRLAETQIARTVKHLIVPCAFGLNAEGNYYYLAGLTRPLHHSSGPFQPGVFRLARMDAVECYEDALGARGISAAEEREVLERIKRYQIAFVARELPSDAPPVRVRLTREGMQQYRRIQHNRPQYLNPRLVADERTGERCAMRMYGEDVAPVKDERTGDVTLAFKCSPYQARIYFRAFGDKAEVLLPETTHEELREMYDEAVAAYTAEDVVVRLTREGMARYHAWYKKRPRYRRDPGPVEDPESGMVTLTFRGQLRHQVRQYFAQFGEMAEIIAPADHAKEMYDEMPGAAGSDLA